MIYWDVPRKSKFRYNLLRSNEITYEQKHGKVLKIMDTCTKIFLFVFLFETYVSVS